VSIIYSCLLVGAGGACGSMARYLVTLVIGAHAGVAFPIATFVVNVTGSFLLGALGTLATRSTGWPPETLRLALGTGFLGAFTTFSTFEMETSGLFRAGHWCLGVAYVAGSVIAGLVALRAGAAISR